MHLRRHAIFSCLAALALITAGCGSDVDDSGTTPTVTGDTQQSDSGAGDGVSSSSGGSDAGSSTSSSGGSSSGGTDAGSSTSSSGGSSSGGTDAGSTSGGSSGGVDAGSSGGSSSGAATKSCKGTLLCGLYANMNDWNQCAADPGCKAAGGKCSPVNLIAAGQCPKLNNPSKCLSGKHMGCKWFGNKCVFVNSCHNLKSPAQCAGHKTIKCAWTPTQCTGFAQKNTCAKAPNQQGCKMAPGCQWTDCKPTNGGVEKCDGIDNDCNGKVDDALTPKGPICDDGDMCNGVEVCKAGKCAAGLAKKCEGKTCFDAKCDAKKGCMYTPNSAGCNDGNPCTTKDACAKGKCAGTGQKDCNDGDKCTKDVCKVINGKATCQNLKGQGCDDNETCTADSCDASNGCTNKPINKACSDGNHCTGTSGAIDTCKAGKCVGGAAVKCDDGNACTKDACDPKKGCTKTPMNGPCDDGNKCTLGEKCTNGACAGSKPKCNDNNLCTSDSCDPKTLACKYAPIPGCKVCTSGPQCNDNNSCTKDSCEVTAGKGKCAHSQIKGCIGPLDYKIVSVVPKTTLIPIPGPLHVRLTVRNDGKPYAGGYKGIMTYKIYLSADGVIDAKDTVLYGNKWKGYNIGAPKKPESYMDIGVSIGKPEMVTGKTHVCVRVEHAQDKYKANNDKCVPVKFLLPDFKANFLKLINTSPVKAGQYAYMDLSYTNKGKAASFVYVRFYASEDNKIDAKDIVSHAIGTKFPALATGKTYERKNWKVQVPVNAQATHKYLCMRVNVYQDAYKTEANPNDNDACGLIKVTNSPDIAPPPHNYIGFKNKAGKVFGNVPWGDDYTCYLSRLTNSGYGNLDAEFPVRCWYSTKITNTPPPQKDGWSVQWNLKAKIGGKKYISTITGTTYDKLDPPKMGVGYICVDTNYDKKVKENSYNNRGCRKITVLGIDLFVRNTSTFGAASWKNPQPTVLKRNVDYGTSIQWCNQGNAVLYGKTKGLQQRILLSKDPKASKDDVVIAETNVFGFSKIGGLNQYGKPSCAHSSLGGKKFKIPSTVAAGKYYLIFDVNADMKYLEPMTNNPLVKYITLQ